MRVFEFLIEGEAHKEKRAEFIKKQLEPKWKGLPGYENLDDFLAKLSEIDPSPKGIYMPWIAKLAFKDPNKNKTEDLNRLAGDLKSFEEHKSKLPNKDINLYKSFSELYTALAPFLKPRKKTAAEKKEERELTRIANLKDQIKTIYQGPEGWVRIPMTNAASCYLGQNTRWCTAGRKDNMFDYYNKSDKLFVIYDKATKERYQLHINSGQFMDAADSNANIEIPMWARKPILNWYKENNPNMGLKHLMFMVKWADEEENIAAGTEHEGLLKLMKDFGVV